MKVSCTYPMALCLLIHRNAASPYSACDAQIYGRPNTNDCFDLYKQLPGETLSPDINPDEPRSFVEPKFLDPPFTPVLNPYRSQMVQLPKIWRVGTSSKPGMLYLSSVKDCVRNMSISVDERCRCSRLRT